MSSAEMAASANVLGREAACPAGSGVLLRHNSNSWMGSGARHAQFSGRSGALHPSELLANVLRMEMISS